jgi:aquaporin Z
MDYFSKKYVAEFVGTFLLVFIGCGSAAFAGGNIGYLGVSIAFGLTLMICAYVLGPISGCHLNPAVTLSVVFARKFPTKDALLYIIAQFLGATIAGLFLYWLVGSLPNSTVGDGVALTGMGEFSPGGYSVLAGLFAEFIGTFVLLFVILLATTKSVPSEFAPLVIGTTLTILLLLFIPVTNGSFNVARSFGVAVFHGGGALTQLLYFAGAHLLSVLAAVAAAGFFAKEDESSSKREKKETGK